MKTVALKMCMLSAVALLATGCASVAVTEDALSQRTSAAIGIEPGGFTISDRRDEGVKTTYAVKTNNGRSFSCYVTGLVTYFGRSVSDAVCTEMASSKSAKAGTAKPVSGSTATCNALLKAAGKC